MFVFEGFEWLVSRSISLGAEQQCLHDACKDMVHHMCVLVIEQGILACH